MVKMFCISNETIVDEIVSMILSDEGSIAIKLRYSQ